MTPTTPVSDDELEKQITAIIYDNLILATDHGQPYIEYDDQAVDAIIALIKAEKTKLLEGLLEHQFWAADDAYDAGDVVPVSIIKESIGE
jgi:hypothetical protein